MLFTKGTSIAVVVYILILGKGCLQTYKANRLADVEDYPPFA